jgi:ribonuclease-3
MRKNGKEIYMNTNRAIESKFKEFQKKLGIIFDNEKMLKQAFTHKTF